MDDELEEIGNKAIFAHRVLVRLSKKFRTEEKFLEKGNLYDVCYAAYDEMKYNERIRRIREGTSKTS